MSVPHFINEKLSFTSRRSAVLGVRCAVSTPQPLATQVGADLLKRGANAVDAAVGIAAALAVTEPCSTGLGGDCFMLLYTKEGGVVGLNASGKCPSRLTLDIARDGVGRDDYIPHSHPYSITVPGAAAGWCDAVERWGSGKLSMAEILEPAALIAEQGFPVSTVTAEAWGKLATTQLQGSGASELMIDENRGPRAGEVFKNPSMARVLRELGKHGKKGFYSGWVADAIVEEVQREGGLMTHDDLSSHCSSFPDPISVEFEGYRLWEVPPNGQGITALMALQVLKASAIDFRRAAARTPERLHAQIEALRIAFADTRHYCADPDSVKVPIEELLSDKYAQERVTLLNPDMANTDTSRGCPESTSCTVSFQVVDSQGMAVSFVNSNYLGFGSGLCPKNLGFSLQSRGSNFSLDPTHPNCLAPGKRPYHTIIPAMVTDDLTGNFRASMTNMGGWMQPQGHVQLLQFMIDGMDPQAAVDEPRFCIMDGTSGGDVAIEEGLSEATISRLRDMGHKLRLLSGYERAMFGRAQIIWKYDNGVLWTGSDGRADGCALAW